MHRIRLAEVSPGESISEAVRVLRGGGVILFPTDTLYGLGADAFSDEAVDKIYASKGRDEGKPVHCITAGIAMAETYAEITPDARLLFERLLPGALTLIVKKRPGVSGGIARGLDTIGIRIPKNDLCIAIAGKFGRPFTATSANVSGKQPQRSIDAILDQLGEAGAHIDLVMDAGEVPVSLPSTVVDLSGGEPVILREGAVPAEIVWNTIGMA